ncbi:MAG TPA: OsmC family protein [Kribbella sp.]|nr:OsmC family protein [Kribbella sp.]
MTQDIASRNRNGVDTDALFATLDAVKEQPELAEFQFRVRNQWMAGTHSQTRITDFYGAGQDQPHSRETVLDADHPAVLTGRDNGPTPVEYVLHALASCLTAGLINIAAARGVELTSVESTVEGDIDLLGILGLSDTARNGYRHVRVSFRIEGDASPEKLRALVEQSRARSAVFDIVTNGVPVDITVAAG